MTPPPPPIHLHMPHQWESLFIALTAVPTVIALAWAVRAWRRDGDLLPVVMMLGGTVCCLLEPLVDVLGLCWYPRGQEVQAFDLMGRPIPLFVVFGYAMTWGGYALLATETLKRRGPRALWTVWGGGMLVMSLFELYAVHTKTYVYYGHAPLRVLDWPTWWEPVNCLGAVTIAVVVTRVRPHLRGWQLLAIVPLMTMIDGGVNGATAWPVYAVLWSHASTAVVDLVGVVTWALAIFGVWLAVTFAPRRGADVAAIPAELVTARSVAGETVHNPV